MFVTDNSKRIRGFTIPKKSPERIREEAQEETKAALQELQERAANAEKEIKRLAAKAERAKKAARTARAELEAVRDKISKTVPRHSTECLETLADVTKPQIKNVVTPLRNATIDRLFNKLIQTTLQYCPGVIPEDAPKYTPSNSEVGPKPLTIEEYRKRQELRKAAAPIPAEKQQKKKSRGGKKFQQRKQLAILYREYQFEGDRIKKKLLKEKIIEVRKNK